MEKFTIKTLEDRISFFKQLAHEPRGKPVTRGIAQSTQVMLECLRQEVKRQAAVNKAKKIRDKNRNKGPDIGPQS